ncbi:MAG TPA: hypothetical protein VE685_06040 [Thermoanaerobaculia bacterium]|nr:hypothetical protein [Thermoanaerobaculia bacterium]
MAIIATLVVFLVFYLVTYLRWKSKIVIRVKMVAEEAAWSVTLEPTDPPVLSKNALVLLYLARLCLMFRLAPPKFKLGLDQILNILGSQSRDSGDQEQRFQRLLNSLKEIGLGRSLPNSVITLAVAHDPKASLSWNWHLITNKSSGKITMGDYAWSAFWLAYNLYKEEKPLHREVLASSVAEFMKADPTSKLPGGVTMSLHKAATKAIAAASARLS